MKAYSVDLRQKVIDAYNQREESQRQLAKRFRVSLTFIENLLKRYRTDGTVEPRAHGGGQVAKLSLEQEAVLMTLVEEKNDAILVELCDRLEQSVGVRISRATMGRYVQKLKLTRKKTLHATERHSERVQQLRVEYWHEIGAVNLEDLVFVDETGSNLAMTRRYARSVRGSRAYNHAPYGRGQNVTLIGAMALRGLVGEITFPGATDALAFKTYVTQVLVPNLWTGACVVMDNLPAHKVNGIREAIEAVGATVIYLSPYSPDFSPIENCWSKIKEFLRARAARTYAQLDQAITDALAAVTTQDIIGWFTHCCCYVSPN